MGFDGNNFSRQTTRSRALMLSTLMGPTVGSGLTNSRVQLVPSNDTIDFRTGSLNRPPQYRNLPGSNVTPGRPNVITRALAGLGLMKSDVDDGSDTANTTTTNHTGNTRRVGGRGAGGSAGPTDSTLLDAVQAIASGGVSLIASAQVRQEQEKAAKMAAANRADTEARALAAKLLAAAKAKEAAAKAAAANAGRRSGTRERQSTQSFTLPPGLLRSRGGGGLTVPDPRTGGGSSSGGSSGGGTPKGDTGGGSSGGGGAPNIDLTTTNTDLHQLVPAAGDKLSQGSSKTLVYAGFGLGAAVLAYWYFKK